MDLVRLRRMDPFRPHAEFFDHCQEVFVDLGPDDALGEFARRKPELNSTSQATLKLCQLQLCFDCAICLRLLSALKLSSILYTLLPPSYSQQSKGRAGRSTHEWQESCPCSAVQWASGGA